MILFCQTETIFYKITSILFSAFPHKKSSKCYSLDPNKVIKCSAFFHSAKFRKFRCFKYFPKNLKIFCWTEGSDVSCLSLIQRLLYIIFWICNMGQPPRNSKRQSFQKMFSCCLKSKNNPFDNSIRQRFS